LSQALRQQFYDDPTGRTEDNSGQRLSNPVLNGRLQKLRETAAEGDSTFRILEDIIAISHSILTQGISLRQLIILGSAIRKDAGRIRHDELREWIEQLGMTSMARLEGALLVELLGMKADELQFTDATKARNTKSAVSDLFRLTQQNAADWYFTQGESIFVRTNNSDAMLWRLRQSVKYMHYYPVEAIPSLAANFAHSLTHIEE
ncbi:MAG: hypothetical protein IJ637_01420, partial [Prevotella sp.]|nr:hypothetical protein [Prevotella sp.]